MRKMKNSKGFTLMEMLIVVAIIAVLVAIAIPTFTTSLNKAKVAADTANIRAGYASVMAQILTDDTGLGADARKYVLQKDGTAKVDGDNNYICQGNTGDKGVEIAGTEARTWATGNTVAYNVTKENDNVKVEIVIPAA